MNSNRIGRSLIAIAVCLVLAAVWAILAVPGTALAKKGGGGNKSGGGKKGGGSNIPCKITFVAGNILSNDGAPFEDGSGSDKIKAQIVLGGHFSFSTQGSIKADKPLHNGRSLFADFTMPVAGPTLDVNFCPDFGTPPPASITLVTVTNPDDSDITFATTNFLPVGTLTEANLSLGPNRFGDEPDGVDPCDGEPFIHNFDMRAMRVADDMATVVNEQIRYDVNLGISIFLKLPDGSNTNLRLRWDPIGVNRSQPGSDFVTVECLGQQDPDDILNPADPTAPAVKWKIIVGSQKAAVHEGGGGNEPHGFYSFPFTAIVEVL